MNLEYKNIKKPEELLEWMSQINYGYQGKTRLHKFDDPDFNEVWFDEYILETPQELIKTKVGNCWDQTELERDWFTNHNYKIKTIYEMVELPYENPYPTHSFLIYIKIKIILGSGLKIQITKIEEFIKKKLLRNFWNIN